MYKKIVIFFIFLINFLYVFRDISVSLKLDSMIYIISVLLIISNFFIFVLLLKKYYFNEISIFLFLGIISSLYSIIFNLPLIGIIGFLVIFLNLILWNSFFKSFDEKYMNLLFIKFVNINLIFSIITAFLGFYQYFFDSSIMGLVKHKFYGDIELMESGRLIKRVTGFMSSPQNLSLYLALFISLVSYTPLNKKNKIIIYLILLFGGILSGSRAYSLFLLIVVSMNFLLSIFIKTNSKLKLLKKIILFFFVILFICIILNLKFSNLTINRIFNFISDWPALKIYIYHLKDLDFKSFLIGKGLGINDRVVVNLLGGKYFNFVGYYVDSYESYLLSIFMQMGIFAPLIFISIYIKSVIIVFQKKDTLYLSILIAIFLNLLFTPSFNGFAMSFLVWPIILYPIYCKNTLNFNL